MLGVKKSARASHSLKMLLRMMSKVSRSLCCHLKAMRIVFVFTRSFSSLLARENSLFEWSSIWSV